VLVCLLGVWSPVEAAGPRGHEKLDETLNSRTTKPGKSRVIVTMKPGWDPTSEVARLGGALGRRLDVIDGVVAELPNGQLRTLANHPGVAHVHHDRATEGSLGRAAATVGARAVWQQYGYNGAGIGVAVIDSGITKFHADLLGAKNTQRVVKFVDFVHGKKNTYDDYGHGTHVAGIIAGNGLYSFGMQAGIAPAANLVGLKVLNGKGTGVISDVIAAIEYAVANKARYNIRVINLSVGANVTTSYWNDPLTLAAKRAVDAGIVVVAAAGNRGKNAAGETQYGGITAPGNAPWVLTVGASSTEGTVERYDDTVASYSSRGPTAYDFQAKPDLVAPGTGMVSLSDPASLLYSTKSAALVSLFDAKPYLSLSGTSMAAPVVSGTVALMLEANPLLTPNLVKAILQYTAQEYSGYDALTQGAGFLNTKGAVDLARFFAKATPGQPYPTSPWWSRKVIWGNHRIGSGMIEPTASAWTSGILWGSAYDMEGDNIVWGTFCDDACDNLVWGTLFSEESDNIVWGTFFSEESDNIVWGTFFSDESDNIVWGTDCGGQDCANVVWGSMIDDGDNLVWGTAEEVDNIVWGTTGADLGTIMWGTSDGDFITVWATAAKCDPAIVACDAPIAWDSATIADSVWQLLATSSAQAFDWLFGPIPSPPPPPPPDLGPTETMTNFDGIPEGGNF
jgi:serine protease AprX